MLIAAGWPDATPFAITWDGTTTDQQTVTTTLGRSTADLKAAGGQPGHRARPWPWSATAAQQRDSCPGSRPSRCSAGGCWCRGPRSRPARCPSSCASYGAVPEEVPTIAVEPPRTPQQMERAVKGLVTGRYQWVAFTSVNAVRAVREKFEEYGLDARAFAGVKVGCGRRADGGGAARLRHPARPGARRRAVRRRAWLEEWPPFDDVLDPINRVLLPRADIATETLVAGLTELGWEVDDVTAYRTVRAAPPPAADPRGDQGRRVRRGAVHLVLDRAEPGRHRGQAARGHGHRGDRARRPPRPPTEFGLRVDVRRPSRR